MMQPYCHAMQILRSKETIYSSCEYYFVNIFSSDSCLCLLNTFRWRFGFVRLGLGANGFFVGLLLGRVAIDGDLTIFCPTTAFLPLAGTGDFFSVVAAFALQRQSY